MRLPRIFQPIQRFTKKYPVCRGMIVYSMLWPTSNFVQQTFYRKEKYNFYETLRYSFYGSCIAAPTLYANVKLLGYLVPAQTFKAAILKALLDQIIYAPFAITTFYMGMTFLEGKSWDEMTAEWKSKFLPTYKLGAMVWPFVQVVNFRYVRERNRVPFIGTVSFFWTTFLSYMKHLELKRLGGV